MWSGQRQMQMERYQSWEDIVIDGFWIMMQVAPGQWVPCVKYEATVH